MLMNVCMCYISISAFMYVCMYGINGLVQSKSFNICVEFSDDFFCDAVNKLEYGRYADLTQEVLNIAINPLSEEQQGDITIG